MTAFSQSGKNCFNAKFDNDATNYNANNAYLLAYLSAMMYPDYGIRFWFPGVSGYGVEGDSVKYLEAHNDKFLNAFSEKLGFLFVDKDAAPTFTLASTNVSKLSTISNSNLALSKNLTSTKADPFVTTYKAPNGQSVLFDFQNKCNSNGYDPEAMIISTPTTIFVVFRGTDRVGCTNVGSFGYDWNEWISSDFFFQQDPASRMAAAIHGKVHSGMMNSLEYAGFADSLASRIIKYGGVTKRVWITGHSLGGGQAQLFAMFLKYNYEISPQGVYVYESPNPGDANFVEQMNNVIGQNKIQRFEFSDDPIPTLPPQAFFYARAGVRNYYKDINSTVERGREQIPLIDDWRLACAFGSLAADNIPLGPVKLKANCIPSGTFCYHDPAWIVAACKHQIASSLYSSLPPDIPIPTTGISTCSGTQAALGRSNDPINNAISSFETSLQNMINNIAWTASILSDNFLDKAIAKGDYELINYKFRNDVRNCMEWPWGAKNAGTPESKISIASIMNDANNKFHIEHDALGFGYRISMLSGNSKRFYIEIPGLPTNGDNGTLAQMQEYHPIDGQIWYFYKLPNTTNVYVIYNKASGKVLDAYNDCPTSASQCKIQQMSASNGDQTQLWILRKL
jgi:hypothetical protein